MSDGLWYIMLAIGIAIIVKLVASSAYQRGLGDGYEKAAELLELGLKAGRKQDGK
jgi:hypothetical protein